MTECPFGSEGQASVRRKLRAETFDEGAIIRQCFACGSSFQHGRHRYGQFIARYQIEVCGICYQAHVDGWAPHVEARIIKHLEGSGIPVPPLNAKGLLPRD